MVESFLSCGGEISVSSVLATARQVDRCFAHEGCVGESGDVLADHLTSAACESEISLSRCNTASSSVTYVQCPEDDGLSVDEQDADIDTDQEVAESFETCWTDEKHCSYLNSMEATFVKNLYDREYCALDICGQAPRGVDCDDPDSAESQPNGTLEAVELQSRQNRHGRPYIFAKVWNPSCSPRVLFANPWVKRFRNQVSCDVQSQTGKEAGVVSSCTSFKGNDMELLKRGAVPSSQDSEASAENVVETWLETSPSLPWLSNQSNSATVRGQSSPSLQLTTSGLLGIQKDSTFKCCLPEGCQEGDIKVRTSRKVSFDQRPSRKQKISGEFS